MNSQKLLPLILTCILLLTACDDDDVSNTSIDIPPAEPNTITLSFDGNELEFNNDEIESSALINDSNQIEKLVITAERTPENQDGHALCIEINDTNLQPDSYPVQSDSASGTSRILLIEVDAQEQQITSFNPAGDGTLNLESLNSSTTTGNFITDFENGSETVSDATGAFNLNVFSSQNFEDVGNCSL